MTKRITKISGILLCILYKAFTKCDIFKSNVFGYFLFIYFDLACCEMDLVYIIPIHAFHIPLIPTTPPPSFFQ